MASIPAEVRDAFAEREPLCVFSTVDMAGAPNAVYILWARILDAEQVLVVNNRMQKTLANIEAGSAGALVFLTGDKKTSYQIKGSLAYYTAGPVYEDMKAWLDPSYPGLGAVVLTVTEVYCGADRLA
jgi:hypothetical protein